MLALVDSDTFIFMSALSAEDEEEWVAKNRLDASMTKVLQECGCSSYKLFVSGGVNFRKEIDPTYKANRTQPDPKHREACRQHLIKEWNAVECDGYEADDACGVEQKQDGSTMIVAIDKDLLQVPGRHYSWPIIRKGQVVREAIYQEISYELGLRKFFTQVLVGDTSDNIKGIYGVGHKKATKLLENCNTEEEIYNVVLQEYLLKHIEGEHQFKKNCDLLWIWRQYGETYTIRQESRSKLWMNLQENI